MTFPLPPAWRVSAWSTAALLLATGLAALAGPAAFQPLNDPALTERHPGKFVWADLFTTDPVAATKFYSGLLGWTANTIVQDGRRYTVLSNGRRPVAGLAPRPPANTKRPSRWVGYIAVADLRTTVRAVTQAGGQVRAEPREFPDRGAQAIIADNEGSTVGLLQSSSGDLADDEPHVGDWNWFVLFVRHPETAAAFYRQIFDYQVTPDLRTERRGDFLLARDGQARAGVAPLPERADAQPGWLGVVRVASIDEALARTVRLGGEVLVPARPAAFGSRFAIIADSTGGAIGLVEYVDNANPAQHP